MYLTQEAERKTWKIIKCNIFLAVMTGVYLERKLP